MMRARVEDAIAAHTERHGNRTTVPDVPALVDAMDTLCREHANEFAWDLYGRLWPPKD
jgi:hypothetical protein